MLEDDLVEARRKDIVHRVNIHKNEKAEPVSHRNSAQRLEMTKNGAAPWRSRTRNAQEDFPYNTRVDQVFCPVDTHVDARKNKKVKCCCG